MFVCAHTHVCVQMKMFKSLAKDSYCGYKNMITSVVGGDPDSSPVVSQCRIEY